jgi:cytidylate kinase
MTIVAISREMGSGGYEIGAAVAKALNFEYVNRQILLAAAHAHGVPEATLVDVVERRPSLWERFDAERRRYLTFLEAAYYAFAERGNLVTASRSGPFFVRDVRHALKVRIMAPVEVRVRRVMAQERLDQKAATAKVRAYDREMSGRIDYLFGVDWTQPENYDLVINTTDDAWEFYTDLLVAAARHPRYGPTPESRQKVRDLSLAAQVRAALATDPGTQRLNVEVTSHEGRVVLTGIVFSPAVLEAAADVAKRVPGVATVSCETVEIPRVYPGPIM